MATNSPAAPICIWLSRHPPTPEQRESLNNYWIKQIDMTFENAEEAWQMTVHAADRVPDLIMPVMDNQMFMEFMMIAQRHTTTVIVPIKDHGTPNSRGFNWTGKWKRCLRVSAAFIPWNPEEES